MEFTEYTIRNGIPLETKLEPIQAELFMAAAVSEGREFHRVDLQIEEGCSSSTN